MPVPPASVVTRKAVIEPIITESAHEGCRSSIVVHARFIKARQGFSKVRLGITTGQSWNVQVFKYPATRPATSKSKDALWESVARH